MYDVGSSLVSAGLLVSVFGLTGVFTVLILFYLVTKVMVAVSVKLKRANESA